MDNSGRLTRDLVAFLRETGGVGIEVLASPAAERENAMSPTSPTPLQGGEAVDGQAAAFF